jgi:hypothetical protein
MAFCGDPDAKVLERLWPLLCRRASGHASGWTIPRGQIKIRVPCVCQHSATILEVVAGSRRCAQATDSQPLPE